MYKVKSRYTTYYDGDNAEEAYQTYKTLKKGGMTNIKMTPDLSAKGFVGDFIVVKNKLLFDNEFVSNLVNKYLKRYESPVELIGKEIVVLNDKFLSKIVYLTENLFQKPAEVTKLAKDKLGITGDIKKWEVSLDGGKKITIFAFNKENARKEAQSQTDNKILNIKELKDG